LPPDNTDQYLNFNNNNSIYQRNYNEQEESIIDTKIDDRDDHINKTTRNLSNQSSSKIFEIKKDEKKFFSENNRMFTNKRSSSNLEQQIEYSDYTRSKVSSVTGSKSENNFARYGINLKNKKEQFENPKYKANINMEFSEGSQQNYKMVNPPKHVLEDLNHTLAGINAGNNPNVFIDPNKNPCISIVNINYGCGDPKAEEKTNQGKYNNIYNNSSAITGIISSFIKIN